MLAPIVVRLPRGKRSEVRSEDLPGNLIIQPSQVE
jgi:hypothetical protein